MTRTVLIGLMVIGFAALSGCEGPERHYGDDYGAARAPAPVYAPAPAYGQSYYGNPQPYYGTPGMTEHEQHEQLEHENGYQ